MPESVTIFTQLIGSVGFPIAACIYMGTTMTKQLKSIESVTSEKNKLIENMERVVSENTAVIRQLLLVITKNNSNK